MIYFVGAGPGDPRLITVKGKELLEQADVVVYAGSLVNPQLLEWCPSQARIFNSASMCLEEIVGVLEAAHRAGETAVRLHTGDPSLYGGAGADGCPGQGGHPLPGCAGGELFPGGGSQPAEGIHLARRDPDRDPHQA